MRTLLAWLHAQHCPYADLRTILREKDRLEGLAPLGIMEVLPQLAEKTRLALLAYEQSKQSFDIEQVCRTHKSRMILWGDCEYPAYFYEIEEPPPVLYVRGQGGLSRQAMFAIIGSRRTTQYGLRNAKRIARNLAQAGIVIVSGLAEGIDTAAHQAALEAGETIAVLGCGIDWIYPKSNARLYEQIAESGLLLSEFPFGEKPYGYHFPFRNRLISGLTEGVILVEGTNKSGAMSTIRHALNQGKMIYALPGDIDRKTSEGPNQLIFEGAEPLLNCDQILDCHAVQRRDQKREASLELTPREREILCLLDQEPMGIEKICNLSNLSIHDIVSVLTSLELYGTVIRQGNHYYRTRR